MLTADDLTLIRTAHEQIVTYAHGMCAVDGVEQPAVVGHRIRDLLDQDLLKQSGQLVQPTEDGLNAAGIQTRNARS